MEGSPGGKHRTSCRSFDRGSRAEEVFEGLTTASDLLIRLAGKPLREEGIHVGEYDGKVERKGPPLTLKTPFEKRGWTV